MTKLYPVTINTFIGTYSCEVETDEPDRIEDIAWDQFLDEVGKKVDIQVGEPRP